MAIDSVVAAAIAGSQQQLSILALRTQFENESATVNLVRDAVRQIQQADAAPADRHSSDHMVDVYV